MNNYDNILSYSKENNGYITTIKEEYLDINSTFLSNLVNNKKQKELEQVFINYPFILLITCIFYLKVVKI